MNSKLNKFEHVRGRGSCLVTSNASWVMVTWDPPFEQTGWCIHLTENSVRQTTNNFSMFWYCIVNIYLIISLIMPIVTVLLSAWLHGMCTKFERLCLTAHGWGGGQNTHMTYITCATLVLHRTIVGNQYHMEQFCYTIPKIWACHHCKM